MADDYPVFSNHHLRAGKPAADLMATRAVRRGLAFASPTPNPGSHDPLEYRAQTAGAISLPFSSDPSGGSSFFFNSTFAWDSIAPYASLGAATEPFCILSSGSLGFYLVCSAVEDDYYSFVVKSDDVNIGYMAGFTTKAGDVSLMNFECHFSYSATSVEGGPTGYFLHSGLTWARMAVGNPSCDSGAGCAGLLDIESIVSANLTDGGIDMRYTQVSSTSFPSTGNVLWNSDFDALAPLSSSSVPALVISPTSLTSVMAEFRGAVWPPAPIAGVGQFVEDTSGDEVGTIHIEPDGLYFDTTGASDGYLFSVFLLPAADPTLSYWPVPMYSQLFVPEDMDMQVGFTVKSATESLSFYYNFGGFNWYLFHDGTSPVLNVSLPRSYRGVGGIHDGFSGNVPLELDTLYRIKFTYDHTYVDPTTEQVGSHGRWAASLSSNAGATWTEIVESYGYQTRWLDGYYLEVSSYGDSVVVLEGFSAGAVATGYPVFNHSHRADAPLA